MILVEGRLQLLEVILVAILAPLPHEVHNLLHRVLERWLLRNARHRVVRRLYYKPVEHISKH